MGWRLFIFFIGSSLVVGPSTALDQIKNKKNGASLSSNAGAPSSARAALMRSEWDPTNGIEIAKGHTRRDKLSLFPSGASWAGEPDDAAQAVVLPAANTHKEAMRIGALAATAASSPQLGGHAGQVQKAPPAEKAAGTTETIDRNKGRSPPGSGALMQAADALSFSSADTASGSQEARSTDPPVVKVSLTVSGVSVESLNNNATLLDDFSLKMCKGIAESGGVVQGTRIVEDNQVALELSAGSSANSAASVKVDATISSPTNSTTAASLKTTLESDLWSLGNTLTDSVISVAGIAKVTTDLTTDSLSVSVSTITVAAAD